MPFDLWYYLNGPHGSLISCECDYCGEITLKTRRVISTKVKKSQSIVFCDSKCMGLFQRNRSEMKCKTCEKKFEKVMSQVTNNNFCSSSCAATYNNTHKTKGTRRSKLEKWLEEQLAILYPDLKILYSDKTTINSELDIYFPSLNLAIELNGIFHYEPIFGEDKLSQIQNNDGRKFQACIEHGIELCIIDTSSQKYFKSSTSQKYLDIITHLVTSKLEASKTDYVEVV